MSLITNLGLTISLLAWSIGFYFSHLVLAAISIVPSTIRIAQMLEKRYLASQPLEAIAGLSRVVLTFAIIGVAVQTGSETLFSGQTFVYIKEQWAAILIQGIGFGLFFGLLNMAITFSTKRVAATLEAKRAARPGTDIAAFGEAARFAIKNTIVIPVSLIFLLRMLRVI